MLETRWKRYFRPENLRGLVRRSIWVLLLGAATYGQTSLAFQVVYVGAKNYVIIDAGSLAGLKKGDKVCFHGSGGDQIACGKAAVVRSKLSGVRLSGNAMQTMAVGTEAKSKAITVQDAPLPTASEVARLARAIDKPKESPRAVSKTRTPVDPQLPIYGVASGINLTYVLTPRLPFVFHVPAYDLDAEVRQSGSLWRQDRKISSSPGGVEGGLVLRLSETIGLVSGLRWRYVLVDSLEGDYVADDPAQYLTGTTRAMAMGVYSAASIAAIQAVGFGVALHLGLDVDRSVVSFSTVREGNAARDTVASLESTLIAMALRLGTHVGYSFGPFTLLIEGQVLAPFYGSTTAKGGDHLLKAEVSSEQSGTSRKDLSNAIGHKRTSLGVQAGLGLGWRF